VLDVLPPLGNGKALIPMKGSWRADNNVPARP